MSAEKYSATLCAISETCCPINFFFFFFADVLVYISDSLSKQSVSPECACVCLRACSVCVNLCLMLVARAASCWSHGAP